MKSFHVIESLIPDRGERWYEGQHANYTVGEGQRPLRTIQRTGASHASFECWSRHQPAREKRAAESRNHNSAAGPRASASGVAAEGVPRGGRSFRNGVSGCSVLERSDKMRTVEAGVTARVGPAATAISGIGRAEHMEKCRPVKPADEGPRRGNHNRQWLACAGPAAIVFQRFIRARTWFEDGIKSGAAKGLKVRGPRCGRGPIRDRGGIGSLPAPGARRQLKRRRCWRRPNWPLDGNGDQA